MARLVKNIIDVKRSGTCPFRSVHHELIVIYFYEPSSSSELKNRQLIHDCDISGTNGIREEEQRVPGKWEGHGKELAMRCYEIRI